VSRVRRARQCASADQARARSTPVPGTVSTSALSHCGIT
jgi:hypothetical protein